MARPPSLPLLLSRKIYKTGQTRGADDDVIYQNRVSRNSTVLIPYELYDELCTTEVATQTFERGCIFLIRPCDYFNNPNIDRELSSKNISLGVNALVFYQLRSDWENYNPKTTGWSVADSREAPLGGEFVARISATTAENNGGKISYGFNTKKMKGAGIRLFEYSSSNKISDCRTQLEAIYWLCHDSLTSAIEFGMTPSNAEIRRQFCLTEAHSSGLLDKQRLYEERMIDGCGYTVCPLCLEKLSAYGFFNRMAQAMGRQVHDLTITEINLFHIDEVRYGVFNHKPYNLGWGHHHCNVVVKDTGINGTLDWINKILTNNLSR